MYTEFIFGAELKKDTPKYIIEGLNRVINHYSADDMVDIERNRDISAVNTHILSIGSQHMKITS